MPAEQLPLFGDDDLAPGDPARARLPRRIKALLAVLDVPRKLARPKVAKDEAAGPAPEHVSGPAWPDSFFDEPR